MNSKVVYQAIGELAQFARRPSNFDYSGYLPIRFVCNTCGSRGTENRALAEKYHEANCERCGAKTEFPFIAPDPATIVYFGFCSATFYHN